MTIIIDGKKLQKEILTEIKSGIASLSFVPVFCDVLVGEDPVSSQYVRIKAKTAKTVGIKFHNANFPANISTEDLVKEIERLNTLPDMCGIIIQLPLPSSLDKRKVLDAIDPHLDVDCLGTIAGSEFYAGSGEGQSFPAALSCVALIDSVVDSSDINLKNKKIAVIGQGELVGKPVAALLHFRGLKPMLVNRYTENSEKEKIIRDADIIISGVGMGKSIKGDMIKQGAILIDAGTSEYNDDSPDAEVSIVGDVDLDSVEGVASYVSPVPGGVGPVTVAMLLRNVLTVAKHKDKSYE